MSKHIISLAKWLPVEISLQKHLEENFKKLRIEVRHLLSRMNSFVRNVRFKTRSALLNHLFEHDLDLQELEDLCDSLDIIVDKYRQVLNNFAAFDQPSTPLFIGEKFKFLKNQLKILKLKICFGIYDIILETGHLFVCLGRNILELVIRLCKIHNVLAIEQKYSISEQVCSNMCSNLLFPLKKISIAKLLQILAMNRAEICCHKLIDCLLETYKIYENSNVNRDEDNESDNSSLEIYRALTKHLSLPQRNDTEFEDESSSGQVSTENFHNMEKLMSNERKNVQDLLETLVQSSPELIGPSGVKKCKATDVMKIIDKAENKVLNYYTEILWGEVANYLDHVVIWWASSPLALRSPHSSQHLREWITEFIPNAELPPVISSTLTSLVDALGVHVTSTSWDQNFRLGIVRGNGIDETGKYLSETLEDLVNLSNQCESTPDWIIGAPLDELPIVEQIPVLHRLDHSIHTTRIWVLEESKKYAHSWNVHAFFRLIKNDVADCLSKLDGLRFQDRTLDIEKGNLGEHVRVNTLMRVKLVSEVRENIQKLREAPAQCVENLAAICRTICLAILKIIFPPASYWRSTANVQQKDSYDYVDKYLDKILLPVLISCKDPSIINQILKLICECWLDHIYMNRIKFSHSGVLKLLEDFARVKSWLSNCPIIEENLKLKMINNEILQRCEGVGKLLLRRPGELLKMVDKKKEKEMRDRSSSDEKPETMPPEMYVPNQEQWLELGAVKMKKAFILPKLCCS